MEEVDQTNNEDAEASKIADVARKVGHAATESVKKATPIVTSGAKKGAELALAGVRRGVQLAGAGSVKAKDVVTSYWRRFQDEDSTASETVKDAEE